MKNMNECIVKVIKELLDGLASGHNKSLEYLLGQAIREYQVPEKNKHISMGAKVLWENLGRTDNIIQYSYSELIVCNEDNVDVKSYKGANRTYNEITLNKGDSFKFNDIFHVEHPVPVKTFKEKLINERQKKGFTEDKIKDTLENIHLCWLTKEEDRQLPRTKGRPATYEGVIDDIYKDKHIEIIQP